MKFIQTPIHEIILIEPDVLGDNRGFFMETYQENQFLQAGINVHFVQDNHSGSRRGALRGLHYQISFAQGKLLRVVVGEIFDVAVDLRRSSQTFGKWVGNILSSENHLQVWIPPGFAHGFYVLSEWAEITYKATDYYAPDYEQILLWNDPELAIDWHLSPDVPLLISKKDAQGKPFAQIKLFE